MQTAIKERLDLIIKELGLSGRAFEKACGLANGSYSSIGNGVGADKLNKILIKFPHISADWLISGHGKMFKSDDTHLPNDDNKGILLRLMDLVLHQQRDISRLIAELEHSDRRFDRILSVIERGLRKNVRPEI